MAGHSKWKQIKHKKAATDAKKGVLFSKLVREISIAAREGGVNPESNMRLRAAMDRARDEGMPKDNVERAIAKATGGGENASLQEFLYEAIGPHGIYILIEGITDNRNRSLAEIKKILEGQGAKFVPQNSLLWNFEKAWTEEGKDYRPKSTVEIADADRATLFSLLDELVEHDDIQEVYTNLAS